MSRSPVVAAVVLALGLSLACASPTPQPTPADPPAPQPPSPAASQSWRAGALSLSFDPSAGLTAGETKPSPELNIETLGDATLAGGAVVEVRAWKPPFKDAPEDDPFGKSAEESKKAVAAYKRACQDKTVEHLSVASEGFDVEGLRELAVHGMMWDSLDYAVFFHHLWTFRTPHDLCVVAWVGTEAQDLFFNPKLKVIAGRADQRFVVIVTQDLEKAQMFAGIAGKPLAQQLADATPIAEKIWDSPEIATVRTFVESLSVAP